MSKYHLKVWRTLNIEEPQVDEIVDKKKLAEWMEILKNNLLSNTTDPLIQVVHIEIQNSSKVD